MDTTVVHNSTKSVELDAAVTVIDEEDGVTIREIVDGVNDTAITVDSDEGVENIIEALEDAIDDEPSFRIGDELEWYRPIEDEWHHYTVIEVDDIEIHFERDDTPYNLWCNYEEAKRDYESGAIRFIDG